MAVALAASASMAQQYEAVADWLELPAGKDVLGPMHGDVAVSSAGET